MAANVQVMTLDDARLLKQLVGIQKTLDAGDGETVEQRWKFGRLLLEHRRDRERLPKGLLNDVAKQTGRDEAQWPAFHRECQRRMQLAEKYQDVKIMRHACRLKSWHDIAAELSGNVHFSSDSPEWYTPEAIIERVVRVFGEIDLDPCADSSRSVPAKRYYTQKENGLILPWAGRVYMNPPYGDDIQAWVEKLCSEPVTEAIALVPARTDTAWFNLFVDSPVCFIRGRLKFSGHDNSAPFPSAVFYIGKRPAEFFGAFFDIGAVWIRWQPE